MVWKPAGAKMEPSQNQLELIADSGFSRVGTTDQAKCNRCGVTYWWGSSVKIYSHGKTHAKTAPSTPATPVPEPKPPSGTPADAGFASLIAGIVSAVKEPLMAEIKAEAAAMLPEIRQTVIKLPEMPEPVPVDGVTHSAFEAVTRLVRANIPVLLVGPAGSGKTFLALQVAKALGSARQDVISCSEGLTEGQILGRLLPTGSGGGFEYEPSGYVQCYEQGGVAVLDEIDNGNANVLTVLNASVSNGHLSVPNRTKNPTAVRHADFRLIACANTYGNGADRLYVGRNQLDAATLDRFRIGTVTVDYDRNLEKTLGIPEEILKWGWAVRDAITAHSLRRIMSTRSLQNAHRAVQAGLSLEAVKSGYFADWTSSEIAKVSK